MFITKHNRAVKTVIMWETPRCYIIFARKKHKFKNNGLLFQVTPSLKLWVGAGPLSEINFEPNLISTDVVQSLFEVDYSVFSFNLSYNKA